MDAVYIQHIVHSIFVVWYNYVHIIYLQPGQKYDFPNTKEGVWNSIGKVVTRITKNWYSNHTKTKYIKTISTFHDAFYAKLSIAIVN